MKQYDIYLRNRITELDVAIRELSLRNDISIKAKLYLLLDEVVTGVEKFVGIYKEGELATSEGVIICTSDGREIIASNKYLPNFILDSSCGVAAKTVLEHIESVSELTSKVDAAMASKITGEIRNDLQLESGTITLLQEWFYSCSALRSLLISSEVGTNITSYFGVKSVSNLLTENNSPATAEKMVSLEETLMLTYNIGCTLEYLLGAEQETLMMSSAVNALLARYRLLGEMDNDAESGADLTLEEFDDMALEDIDFVVIE